MLQTKIDDLSQAKNDLENKLYNKTQQIEKEKKKAANLEK